MFGRSSPEVQTHDEEVVDAPVPILAPIDREEMKDSERPTMVRDFAYSADDPLFWRLEEPPDRVESMVSSKSGHDFHDNSVGQYGDAEEGGFTGTPPWLQFSNDGELSEEDHMATQADDELHGRAVALFDFTPEHENEFALHEGQTIYVSSRHGLGWLVAVDIYNGDCGLVPEEYVRLLEEDEDGFLDPDHDGNPIGKDPITTTATKGEKPDDTGEWVDEPGSVHSGLDQLDHKTAESSATKKQKAPEDLSDAERQEILDAAEREMALNEARFSNDS